MCWNTKNRAPRETVRYARFHSMEADIVTDMELKSEYEVVVR
jgi:hypothetical protein